MRIMTNLTIIRDASLCRNAFKRIQEIFHAKLVLSRKRLLTINMIRKFSKAFNISADLLIKEYELV